MDDPFQDIPRRSMGSPETTGMHLAVVEEFGLAEPKSRPQVRRVSTDCGSDSPSAA